MLLFFIFFNFDQVHHFVDHSLYLWGYFNFDGLIHAFEPEGSERSFLAFRPSNPASYLFNFQFFHAGT